MGQEPSGTARQRMRQGLTARPVPVALANRFNGDAVARPILDCPGRGSLAVPAVAHGPDVSCPGGELGGPRAWREMGEPSLDWFRVLKPRWKVAIAAMIYRVQDLGIVTEQHATSLWKGRSARGWTKREPLDDELLPERPRVLHDAFVLLVEEGAVHVDELRDMLPLPGSEIERLAGLGEGFLGSRSRPVVSLPPKGKKPFGRDSSGGSNVVEFPVRKGEN